MIKQLIVSCLSMAMISAFVPLATRTTRKPFALSMAAVDVPPAPLEFVQSSQSLSGSALTRPATSLSQGVESYLATSSPTTTLALQERRAPTKEEVEAKKRNFNLIFWGGGFVAPFLATIFYFGFKFWEK